MRRRLTALVALCLATALTDPTASMAGVIFGNTGLSGGFRWDAAPRTINGNERSLSGGLRYSLQGGSFEAYRDSFTWVSVPSVANFQNSVESAFNAWTVVDPVSGFGTDISFTPDLGTTVVGTGGFGGVNFNGAEIGLFASNAGDSSTRAVAFFDAIFSPVTLTSGTMNYPGAGAISGADININNNSGAVYSLDFFRRLLTHEIGHTIGLSDLEGSLNPNAFIDDNYDNSSSVTALATLTNSWADLVNPLDPSSSVDLSLFNVLDGDPGIGTAGVDLLMESFTLGITAGNPVTNLFPLTNDEFGTRQFLYPSVTPVPEPSSLMLCALSVLGLLGYRRKRKRRNGTRGTSGEDRRRVPALRF